MQTEGSCFVYICNLVKSRFVTVKRKFVTYEYKKFLFISAMNEMFLFYSLICTFQASSFLCIKIPQNIAQDYIDFLLLFSTM